MALSYQLETSARRTSRPTPLDLANNTRASSFALQEPLLYDLPISSSLSPPNSPTNKTLGLTSPTSPRQPRNTRPIPSPSKRNRSATPSGITANELEKFGEICRAWYFDQDDASGRLMTQTLAATLPSQRAPYSRLQASIRSAYHKSVAVRKATEFQAHLAATQPGGSLTHFCRTNPDGRLARKERYERLDRFVRQWATEGMPGTRPFFESLWAIMKLQITPAHLGGAGAARINWEFDDAVFREAAGKDFMLEAVSVLKGVLAFEERPSPRRATSTSSSFDSIERPEIHSRSHSQPLPSSSQHPHLSATPIATTSHTKRSRAPSDPFTDTPILSRSLASASSYSIGPTTISGGFSNHPDEADEDSPSPSPSPLPSPYPVHPDLPHRNYTEFEYNPDICYEEELRIWTSPDLPNQEYHSLLQIFPPFITQRTLPLFPTPDQVGGRVADIEEAAGGLAAEGNRIRFGTGTLWLGTKERTEGWRGGLWTRFILWMRRVFC